MSETVAPKVDKIDVEALEAMHSIMFAIDQLKPVKNDMFPNYLKPKPSQPSPKRVDLPDESEIALVNNPARLKELTLQAIKVREAIGNREGEPLDLFQLAEELRAYVTTVSQVKSSGAAQHYILFERPAHVPSFMSRIKTGKYDQAVVLNDAHSEECNYFNTAKRLSHILLDQKVPSLNARDPYDFANQANTEANTLAILLLMPTVEDNTIPGSEVLNSYHIRARLEIEEAIAA